MTTLTQSDGVKTVTFRVTPELSRRIKVAAAQKVTSVQRVLTDAVERYLEEEATQ